MNASSTITIGTHDGSFHADDVLAVAILSTIFPNHQIIRSRDMDVLKNLDILVDVGDVYDHQTRRYDHHMHNPPMDKFDHILSSAGLIWRHYAKAYLNKIGIPKQFKHNDREVDLIGGVEKNIRIHWIYPIDRGDNGLSLAPTTISEIVRSLRPTDPEKSMVKFDRQFFEAVSMVSHLFHRSCFHSADHVIVKTKCTSEEKRYLCDEKIVLSRYSLNNLKIFNASSAHFSICPSQEYEGSQNHFVVRPIIDSITKEFKTKIPQRVLGTRKEVIEKELGLSGISYVHHTGHLVLAESEEAGIAFCEYLLNQS